MRFATGGTVEFLGGSGGKYFCGTMGSNDFSQLMNRHKENRTLGIFHDFIFDFHLKGNLKRMSCQYFVADGQIFLINTIFLMRMAKLRSKFTATLHHAPSTILLHHHHLPGLDIFACL
jgi:hypothetical protein